MSSRSVDIPIVRLSEPAAHTQARHGRRSRESGVARIGSTELLGVVAAATFVVVVGQQTYLLL